MRHKNKIKNDDDVECNYYDNYSHDDYGDR